MKQSYLIRHRSTTSQPVLMDRTLGPLSPDRHLTVSSFRRQTTTHDTRRSHKQKTTQTLSLEPGITSTTGTTLAEGELRLLSRSDHAAGEAYTRSCTARS